MPAGTRRVLLGLLMLATAHTAVAASPVCDGRFVVSRTTGRLLQSATGTMVGDVVSFAAGVATIDPACPATVRYRRRRDDSLVRAHWPRCGGRPMLQLQATLDADCSALIGRVWSRAGRHLSFAALRSTCGDALIDAGGSETCDDGNALDGDTCSPTCQTCDPTAPPYPSTWAGIQDNLIRRYGCAGCHDDRLFGGLDLRLDAGLYARVVNAPSAGVADTVIVRPGDPEHSLLWLKLIKGVRGGFEEVGGGGMPLDGRITEEELQGVAAWIRAGAPAEGMVEDAGVMQQPCRPR